MVISCRGLLITFNQHYCLIAEEKFEDFSCIGVADPLIENAVSHNIISSNLFLIVHSPLYPGLLQFGSIRPYGHFLQRPFCTSALEIHLAELEEET